DEHGLSTRGRAFVAGQLVHARAMCAVLAPTVNSYKRIGRGFDAPSYLLWSHSSPYAVIRVPRPAALRRSRPLGQSGAAAGGGSAGHSAGAGETGRNDVAGRSTAGAMRIELRCPDPSCNPYLAFAVALAAGLDG